MASLSATRAFGGLTMSKSALFGIVTAALITLATIYAFNRFSKNGGVSTLGAKKTA